MTQAKFAVLAAVAVLAFVVVATAGATKPGSGSSTGVASVFVPNPVQSLGNENLTDQKDAASAVPAAAYHDVTLRDLDGSGFLRGKYATVVSETGTRRTRRRTRSGTRATRTSSSR